MPRCNAFSGRKYPGIFFLKGQFCSMSDASAGQFCDAESGSSSGSNVGSLFGRRNPSEVFLFDVGVKGMRGVIRKEVVARAYAY